MSEDPDWTAAAKEDARLQLVSFSNHYGIALTSKVFTEVLAEMIVEDERKIHERRQSSGEEAVQRGTPDKTQG